MTSKEGAELGGGGGEGGVFFLPQVLPLLLVTAVARTGPEERGEARTINRRLRERPAGLCKG